MRGSADRNRGFYNKYLVTRRDGSSEKGGRHEGCMYFVLDLDHDEFAAAALRAYAEKCQGKFPLLAADLDLMASQIEGRIKKEKDDERNRA